MIRKFVRRAMSAWVTVRLLLGHFGYWISRSLCTYTVIQCTTRIPWSLLIRHRITSWICIFVVTVAKVCSRRTVQDVGQLSSGRSVSYSEVSIILSMHAESEAPSVTARWARMKSRIPEVLLLQVWFDLKRRLNVLRLGVIAESGLHTESWPSKNKGINESTIDQWSSRCTVCVYCTICILYPDFL